MTQYRYTGPGPETVWLPTGDFHSEVIVRPGDVWEFAEEPAFGQWQLISTGESSEKPSEATDSTAPTQSHADEAENAPTGQPEPSSTPEA